MSPQLQLEECEIEDFAKNNFVNKEQLAVTKASLAFAYLHILAGQQPNFIEKFFTPKTSRKNELDPPENRGPIGMVTGRSTGSVLHCVSKNAPTLKRYSSKI